MCWGEKKTKTVVSIETWSGKIGSSALLSFTATFFNLAEPDVTPHLGLYELGPTLY